MVAAGQPGEHHRGREPGPHLAPEHEHQRDGGQQTGQRYRQCGRRQPGAARIVGGRRRQVLGAQLHAGVLGDAVADLAQQLGDGRAAAGRDQQCAAVRPERDAAVDVPVADRIPQRGLAGVVGDLERAGRVVLEDVGDSAPLAACGPAAPIGTLCGFERAAGRAKAIATIAITTASTTTIPVARSAAGGSWVGEA